MDDTDDDLIDVAAVQLDYESVGNHLDYYYYGPPDARYLEDIRTCLFEIRH